MIRRYNMKLKKIKKTRNAQIGAVDYYLATGI